MLRDRRAHRRERRPHDLDARSRLPPVLRDPRPRPLAASAAADPRRAPARGRGRAGDARSPSGLRHRRRRWSPKGSTIAYLRDAADATEICVAFRSGRPGRVLARVYAADDLAWSPDGRWLAYVAENEAKASGLPNTVWAVRADGSGLKRLARFHEPVYSLSWGIGRAVSR